MLNQQPVVLVINSEVLTNRGRDKMATILQAISNAFSSMIIGVMLFKFDANLFSGTQLTSIGSDNGWRRTGNKQLSEPMMIA